MITPIRFPYLAFALQPQETILPSVQRCTRLLSTATFEDAADLPTFPRWLRLAAFGSVSQRHELTVHVADAINSKSGGFVSNANLLSDMVTTILIEDIETQKIPDFWLSLKELDLELTNASKDQLELCQQLLSASDDVPPEIKGVLQLTWKGAEGKLRHEIPADG
ncbi:MAG: hypothetical protein SGBAC_006488 [Bacillariaceae sp.]